MTATRSPKPVVRRDGNAFTVSFADGTCERWISFADATAIARRVAAGEAKDTVLDELFGCGEDEWFPTCSICDGAGHGYPGAGPCPLEDRGYDTDGIWR